MAKGKIQVEQLKEFWKHNIHPITGYRATIYRSTTPYVKKKKLTINLNSYD